VTDIERIPRAVAGTASEVAVLPGWCDQHQFRSIVVVGSPDHSRRLRRMLRRSMKNHPTRVTVRPAPYSEFDPERWWETRALGGVTRHVFVPPALGAGETYPRPVGGVRRTGRREREPAGSCLVRQRDRELRARPARRWAHGETCAGTCACSPLPVSRALRECHRLRRNQHSRSRARRLSDRSLALGAGRAPVQKIPR
jgi:hypothetical protein